MNEFRLREMHRFSAAGRDFVYLVPSAAVFVLDEAASAVFDALSHEDKQQSAIVDQLGGRFPSREIEDTISELRRVDAIAESAVAARPVARTLPPIPFPLTTLALNVTTPCSLPCTSAFEYADDRIVDRRTEK